VTDKRSHFTDQSGQSLIETIVAIFILTTALIASLGLAIYAFSTAGLSAQEVIATNLAREGVEVMRMIRDSNWLASDTTLTSCSDLSGKLCYPNAYSGPTANLLGAISKPTRILFNSTTSTWTIDTTSSNYNLYLQPDGTYTHNPVGNSVFARRIVITSNVDVSKGYTVQNPELVVQSIVGWRGKNCTWAGQDPSIAPVSCKVVVEEHLTNWKDYK